MNLDRSLCPSAAYTRGDKETQAIHTERSKFSAKGRKSDLLQGKYLGMAYKPGRYFSTQSVALDC
jgi:hypothetical protein